MSSTPRQQTNTELSDKVQGAIRWQLRRDVEIVFPKVGISLDRDDRLSLVCKKITERQYQQLQPKFAIRTVTALFERGDGTDEAILMVTLTARKEYLEELRRLLTPHMKDIQYLKSALDERRHTKIT